MDKKAFQNCVPKEKVSKDRDMTVTQMVQENLTEDWKTS